jgi:5'-nucleotidase
MTKVPASRRLLLTLAALIIALSALWATAAYSKPGPGPKGKPPAHDRPGKPDKPAPSGRTVEIQILGLNETHGQLTPLSQSNADGSRTPVGGAAALATHLENEESENSRTLIVDSGDFMQGPAISSYFEGKPTVEVYNEIGVDSVAVGNHEFDWGRDALEVWPKSPRELAA